MSYQTNALKEKIIMINNSYQYQSDSGDDKDKGVDTTPVVIIVATS